MIIKKFLHSCILIEDKGKKILFDPGSFSFVDKKITPADIGAVDVIFITHAHADHFYPEALKTFVAMNRAIKIYGPRDVAEIAKQEGLIVETLNGFENLEIAGFDIKVVAASHGPLPVVIPDNLAYLVNGRFLNPGDSVTVDIKNVEILALPTFAPWERTLEAIDFAKRLNPKAVIPVHDWIVKDLFLDRIYSSMIIPALEKEGIKFARLEIGDKLEV